MVVDDILDSGVHLLSLINDILDLSKIEAGKFEMELKEVSISEYIMKIYEFFKKKAVLQNITFTHEVSQNLGKIYLDQKRIRFCL